MQFSTEEMFWKGIELFQQKWEKKDIGGLKDYLQYFKT